MDGYSNKHLSQRDLEARFCQSLHSLYYSHASQSGALETTEKMVNQGTTQVNNVSHL